LHLQVRSQPRHRLVVFVIDTSDSMGDGPTARITAALGASLALASRAYLNRDQVCLITFRDRTARLAVPPTSSVMLVRQEMQQLPVGGATPLAAGLQKAREVIRQARIKHQGVTPLMVLISDGEATVSLEPGADPVDEALALAARMRQEKIPVLVIDTLEHHKRLNLMPRLARALGGECRHIHDLRSEQVLQLIEQSGPSQPT
jgi:magnesium chelatase subunit D